MTHKYVIYTDGACSMNGQSGAKAGWATVVDNGEHRWQNTGRVPGEQTNNRAELSAAIGGLKTAYYLESDGINPDDIKGFNEPLVILVKTDSAYLVNAVNNKWVHEWARNGWVTKQKTPVKNADLWKELICQCKKAGRKVEFEHIQGHTGDKYNELCDSLAKSVCA